MDSTSKSSSPPFFFHVLLVGFHHLKGPITEYCYPELPKEFVLPKVDNSSSDQVDQIDSLSNRSPLEGETSYVQLPELWNFLPFAALPDGSHQKDTGTSSFTLPPLDDSESFYSQTLFGISKFRQIETEKVANRTSEMSRTHIQKAIVVIARLPAVGLIDEKLHQVTEAYFNQLDFSDKSIFQDFFNSLSAIISSEISDDLLYTGLPLPSFINLFQDKSLVLLKLLLLQKKILFYGTSMGKVGMYQFSLLALLEKLNRHLNCSGDISSWDADLDLVNNSLSNGGEIRQVAENFVPPLFGKQCVFQPCLTLQQLDVFTFEENGLRSFLAGTTNQLFEAKDDFYDVRVDVDTGDILYIDHSLGPILNLTSADLKFVSSVCQDVQKNFSSGVEDDSVYLGSSLYIRQSFKAYFESLAASVLHSQTLKTIAKENQALKGEYQERVSDILDEFNLDWINYWAKTPNFKALIGTSHNSMKKFDIDTLGHPGHGATVFDSLQIRLAGRLKNLNIEQNFTPVKEKLDQASGMLSKTLSGFYSDLQKKPEPDTQRSSDKNPVESLSKAASEQAFGFVSNMSSWFNTAKEKAATTLMNMDRKDDVSDTNSSSVDNSKFNSKDAASDPTSSKKEDKGLDLSTKVVEKSDKLVTPDVVVSSAPQNEVKPRHETEANNQSPKFSEKENVDSAKSEKENSAPIDTKLNEGKKENSLSQQKNDRSDQELANPIPKGESLEKETLGSDVPTKDTTITENTSLENPSENTDVVSSGSLDEVETSQGPAVNVLKIVPPSKENSNTNSQNEKGESSEKKGEITQSDASSSQNEQSRDQESTDQDPGHETSQAKGPAPTVLEKSHPFKSDKQDNKDPNAITSPLKESSPKLDKTEADVIPSLEKESSPRLNKKEADVIPSPPKESSPKLDKKEADVIPSSEKEPSPKLEEKDLDVSSVPSKASSPKLESGDQESETEPLKQEIPVPSEPSANNEAIKPIFSDERNDVETQEQPKNHAFKSDSVNGVSEQESNKKDAFGHDERPTKEDHPKASDSANQDENVTSSPQKENEAEPANLDSETSPFGKIRSDSKASVKGVDELDSPVLQELKSESDSASHSPESVAFKRENSGSTKLKRSSPTVRPKSRIRPPRKLDGESKE